eukprot:scaffold66013_cov42-Phaeocystis_antarctica.AAC.2
MSVPAADDLVQLARHPQHRREGGGPGRDGALALVRGRVRVRLRVRVRVRVTTGATHRGLE